MKLNKIFGRGSSEYIAGHPSMIPPIDEPDMLSRRGIAMVGLLRSCYFACLFLLLFVIGDIDLSPLILLVPLLGNSLVIVYDLLVQSQLGKIVSKVGRGWGLGYETNLAAFNARSKADSGNQLHRLSDLALSVFHRVYALKAFRITALYSILLFLAHFLFVEIALHPDNFNADWSYVLFWSRLDLYLVSVLCIGYISTVYLYYPRLIFVIEFALLFLLFVAITTNHEAFQLSQLRVLSDLSWRLGFSALGILLCMGSIFVVFLLLNGLLSQFLYLERLKAGNSHLKPFPLAKYSLSAVALVSTVCLFLLVVKDVVLGFYAPSASSIFTNGVSLENEQAPLNFNSALGATRDPVGLVKLDREFNDNIYSPIIYFREDALSKIVGNVIEQGEKEESSIPSTYETSLRRKVGIEFYPLIAEARPLAIDFPLSVEKIANPNPSRFQDAYRSLSMALIGQLGALSGHKVGSSDWGIERRFRYLEKHPDIRYQRFAERVIGDETDPVSQAFKLQRYLIENAIYTLAPNHEVKEGEDNTAAFLFGDKRGYCVHFAHAMVFMLRALEIPSRIGTGYMTDIRRSVDGNVLLRMSDRHAWAEMYIDNVGWVTLDVQPEQIESHADSEVDKELLEELIEAVEQSDEDGELDAQVMKEHGEVTNFLVKIVKWFERVGYRLLQGLFGLLLIGALSPVLARIYLRYSYKLFPQSVKCYYRSVYYLLVTDGFPRARGEALEDFARRVCSHYSAKDEIFVLYREFLFKGRQDFDAKGLAQSYQDFVLAWKAERMGASFREIVVGTLRRLTNFRGLSALFGV